MDEDEAAVAVVVAVGPLVVDDWRRIQGKLPKAMSTSDSRLPLPLMLVREREDDPPPPPVRVRVQKPAKHKNKKELLRDNLIF